MENKESVMEYFFWLLLWILIWGFDCLLEKGGVSYTNNFEYLITYFVLASIFVIVIFYDNLMLVIKENLKRTIPIIIIIFILNIAVIYIFSLLFKVPYNIIESYPDYSILTLNVSYFVTKFFDVILQQILIYILYSIMIASDKRTNFFEIVFKRKTSLLNTAIFFCFIFTAMHILLLFIYPNMFSMIFTIGASIYGFMFPYIQKKSKTPVIVTFAIHYTFYTILSIVFIFFR